jgi:RsiW-degrading membrane proteinase PrsW (M82 family)
MKKILFDCSSHLGQFSTSDEDVRKGCKNMQAGISLREEDDCVGTWTDLENGRTDRTVWNLPEDVQAHYYPIMDRFYSIMNVRQEPLAEAEEDLAIQLKRELPAVLWCMLFLPYHREQLSRVFLMFFAGMMSTAPILFYDTLVRHGVELQFFYFRIVPESFNVTSQSLVMGQLSGGSTVRTTVLSLLLTFLCVGFIEEFSKYWVLRKSGQSVFSSIDDVIQLSIIVAIGFAFAENIISTGYFVSFVKQFVMVPSPNWSAFFSNVAGRAVLTSMVHIISTGLMGYFLGRALFAESLLAEHPKRVYLVTDLLHGILGLPKKRVFQMVSFLTGITLAESAIRTIFWGLCWIGTRHFMILESGLPSVMIVPDSR